MGLAQVGVGAMACAAALTNDLADTGAHQGKLFDDNEVGGRCQRT